VFSDGTLVELLYNREEGTTALAVAHPDGRRQIESYLEICGERLVPYAATNNLLVNGCVLLPQEIGESSPTADLVDDLQSFIDRYADLSPVFAAIAPYYVLLSWVFDAFGDLPYLRFRGDYGTGKTRALLTLGSVSYKPFFASGASTVSPIFHILDAFRGTLVLDEADLRFSDATAQLIKILNNGTTKGVPILRTMANRHGELNPRAFNVFGPKIVAMRESFADRALESRFLTEETGGRELRPGLPVHVPPHFHEEARKLRDRLLAWRIEHRHRVAVAPERQAAGLEPRFNQASLALLSLIDDPAVRAQLVGHLEVVQDRVRQDRAATLEGEMLRQVMGLLALGGPVSVARLAAAMNASTPTDQAGWTSKRVGAFLRTRLRVATHKSRGVYLVPPAEWPKVRALAERFGVSPQGGVHVARTSAFASAGSAGDADHDPLKVI
jgi:hypothetical protein